MVFLAFIKLNHELWVKCIWRIKAKCNCYTIISFQPGMMVWVGWKDFQPYQVCSFSPFPCPGLWGSSGAYRVNRLSILFLDCHSSKHCLIVHSRCSLSFSPYIFSLLPHNICVQCRYTHICIARKFQGSRLRCMSAVGVIA